MSSDNSPPISVERAGVASARVLEGLHAAAFYRPGDETWSERAFSDVLNSVGSFCLIATLEGTEGAEPCGFSACRVLAQEAELLSLGVVPSVRRTGVAGLLIEQSIARCRQIGARDLFLEVADDNPGAQRLYRGLGFEQVGIRQNYYHRLNNEHVDARTMRLVLD
jgi:[ribosomal protein S18]-alanine N-acetyltransferase